MLQSSLPPCYVRQSRNSGLSARAKLPFFTQVKNLLNEYFLSQNIKMKGAAKLTKQLHIPTNSKVCILPEDAILTDASRADEWQAYRKSLPKLPKKTKTKQKSRSSLTT